MSLRQDDGRVRRRSVYARTKTEARERMQELLREVARGLPIPDERMTVEGYLRQWLRDVEWSVRPLTIAAYRRWLLIHVVPAHSRRTLGLPGPAVGALRAQRARQAELQLAAGSAWHEPIPNLVFTTATGSPFHGPTVTHELQAALARAELRPRRFHDLRHGCATLLLAAGTDIAVVRDILGHSTIGLTADTYAGVLPSLQREAVARLEGLMRSTTRRERR